MQPSARTRVIDIALFCGAWWLRVGWMGQLGGRHRAVVPGSLRSIRQVFDGHERLLYESFTGQTPTLSPQAWPLSVYLHRALGLLTEDPAALLFLAGTLGAMTAVWVSMGVRRRWGLWPGACAGALVALLPEHVAWSTSAVPVVHGLACLTAAAVTTSGPLRVILAALAAAFRPELAVPAVFLGRSGLAAVAVSAVQLGWLGGPPGAELWPVLRVNLPLLTFLGPATLGLGLLAVRDRPRLVLAGLVLTVHLVGACFSDYGARHALPAAVALCVLVASHSPRPWLPLVVGLSFLPELMDLRERWHRSDARPSEVVSAQEVAGCLELSDEPPIPGQPRPSWVELVSGGVSAPCVVWKEAPEHTEWSSRGLRDRAIRMRSAWTLVPVHTELFGSGRPWRRTWLLTDGPGIRGTMAGLSDEPSP